MANKKIEGVKKEFDAKVKKGVKLTEKEEKEIADLFKASKLPVEFKDEDFEMGERELDIRKLCKENKEQILFRLLSVSLTQQRQIAQMLMDVERFLMFYFVNKGMSVETFNKDFGKMLEDLQNNALKKEN